MNFTSYKLVFDNFFRNIGVIFDSLDLLEFYL